METDERPRRQKIDQTQDIANSIRKTKGESERKVEMTQVCQSVSTPYFSLVALGTIGEFCELHDRDTSLASLAHWVWYSKVVHVLRRCDSCDRKSEAQNLFTIGLI